MPTVANMPGADLDSDVPERKSQDGIHAANDGADHERGSQGQVWNVPAERRQAASDCQGSARGIRA